MDKKKTSQINLLYKKYKLSNDATIIKEIIRIMSPYFKHRLKGRLSPNSHIWSEDIFTYEIYTAFVKAHRDYDDTKGAAFSTYLIWKLELPLRDLIKEENNLHTNVVYNDYSELPISLNGKTLGISTYNNKVEEILKTLDNRDKKMLLLRVEGFTISEISKTIGMSFEWTRMRMKAIYTKVKNKL